MSYDDILHLEKLARLRKAIEKNAGFWQNFTSALKPERLGNTAADALIGAGITSAAAGLGLAAKSGFEALRTKIEKPKAFRAMIDASPGLGKLDPKATQMTFNTLYGMNRQMAKDPLVASSFVGRNVGRAEVGGEAGAYVDLQSAKTLIDATSRGKGSNPLMESWMSGAGSANPYKSQEAWLDRQRYEREMKKAGGGNPPPNLGGGPSRGPSRGPQVVRPRQEGDQAFMRSLARGDMDDSIIRDSRK